MKTIFFKGLWLFFKDLGSINIDVDLVN